MSELQSKLEKRRSRIAAFAPTKGLMDGEEDPLAAYRDLLDLKTADKETLLELISICSAFLPPGNISLISF